MKKLIRNICIGVLILCMVAVAGLVVYALVLIWQLGYWWVIAIIVAFALSVIGVNVLSD